MKTWTAVFALLLCGTAQAEPLVISAGALPLATTGGVLWMNALPDPQFFGTVNGMPAEPTYFSVLLLTGTPGASVSGPLSNLTFDSLEFQRDEASANLTVMLTDTRNSRGTADTILFTSGGAIANIGLGGFGVTGFSFSVLAFSVHSTSPLMVTYGTGPDALTVPFAVAIDLDSSRGPGTASIPLEWTGDSSGIVFGASRPFFVLPAMLTFSNPSLGTLQMSTTLHAGSSGNGEWHIEGVTPEPGTVGFVVIGAIVLAVFRRSTMRTNRD